MREKNVKEIVRYYYEIPEMVRLLKTEQREQESLYDTLKGTGGDGMPGGHGSSCFNFLCFSVSEIACAKTVSGGNEWPVGKQFANGIKSTPAGCWSQPVGVAFVLRRFL